MKLYFYISYDTETPTDKAPEGVNLLSQFSKTPYLVGDAEDKTLPVEIEEFEKGAYIKIYAVNEDTYEHTIDAQITIELGGGPFGLW